MSYRIDQSRRVRGRAAAPVGPKKEGGELRTPVFTICRGAVKVLAPLRQSNSSHNLGRRIREGEDWLGTIDDWNKGVRQRRELLAWFLRILHFNYFMHQ